VGRSGSGKTTLTYLLLRHWDVQTGKILLGGKDVRSFKLADLRRQIALVSQDTYLLNTSVSENLRLGGSDMSRKDIELAARQVNAHDLIMMLLENYDTKIGERGMQLSGGQRQRIAIAKAILKDSTLFSN
jgi:ABC-type multidrug transport system fused ATPase/permease subunit